MRAQAKRLRHEEEEESAFVSMTDMTVGFLFIMMILLAFFASQMGDQDTVPRSQYEQAVAERDKWRHLAESRAEIISRLEADIEELKQRRNELQAQVNALEAELEAAKAKVEELTAELREANAKVKELIADLREANEKIKELTRELQAARDEIEQLKEQIKRLLRQIETLEEEIANLRQQLAALRQVDPLESYLAQVAAARRLVLTRLRDAIKADFPDLQVELSEESDALRFQGEGLFARNSATIARGKREIVSRLAARLDEVLPCYTLGEASSFDESCNPGFVLIEAVQIEGHTDSSGTDRRNRELSAERANSTFFAMTQAAQGLMAHENLKRQPVLSVAAYGPDRPVTSNETGEGKATNRRIDLRFIMVTPQNTNGIDEIRKALRSVGDRP